jgi:hypothetical protein
MKTAEIKGDEKETQRVEWMTRQVSTVIRVGSATIPMGGRQTG